MTRNHQSAKAAGARFERQIADHLDACLPGRINTQPLTATTANPTNGAGTPADGRPIAIECKNTTRTQLANWIHEAHTEADNLGAAAGIIIHKRHGRSAPAAQWVTMTVADLTAILANLEGATP
jgi:hypothetical protein